MLTLLFSDACDAFGKQPKRPRLELDTSRSFLRSSQVMNVSTSTTQNASGSWWPEEAKNQTASNEPLYNNVGTVLEQFIGLRARDLWLKTDEQPIIPLPPFANFAYEWGVGDLVQSAARIL